MVNKNAKERMRNLLVNWDDKTIVFEGNYQTEREVARMIADISSKKYMMAWDIDVYRVYPRTDNPIIWMNLFPAFGDKNIKMSIPGVVGRALVVGPEINTKTLQEFLFLYFSYTISASKSGTHLLISPLKYAISLTPDELR